MATKTTSKRVKRATSETPTPPSSHNEMTQAKTNAMGAHDP
jgi:hypothetical protein